MALIIKSDPGILRRPGRFQTIFSDVLFPGGLYYDEKYFAGLNFLLAAEEEQLGPRKQLSTWYRDFARYKTIGLDSLVEAHSLMLDLEPDLSTTDEEGDAPLHYVGHAWPDCTAYHSGLPCPFIFSNNLLQLLILKYARLFIPHADGTIPFSTILERISSHIGFMAFRLWDKPLDQTRLLPEVDITLIR